MEPENIIGEPYASNKADGPTNDGPEIRPGEFILIVVLHCNSRIRISENDRHG